MAIFRRADGARRYTPSPAVGGKAAGFCVFSAARGYLLSGSKRRTDQASARCAKSAFVRIQVC